MSHLRKRSETTLGWMTADRAVADGPNINARNTPTLSGQRPRRPAGLCSEGSKAASSTSFCNCRNIARQVALRHGRPLSPARQMECNMTAKDKNLNDLLLD